MSFPGRQKQNKTMDIQSPTFKYICVGVGCTILGIVIMVVIFAALGRLGRNTYSCPTCPTCPTCSECPTCPTSTDMFSYPTIPIDGIFIQYQHVINYLPLWTNTVPTGQTWTLTNSGYATTYGMMFSTATGAFTGTIHDDGMLKFDEVATVRCTHGSSHQDLKIRIHN